jgi:thymidylate synthase ThyX
MISAKIIKDSIAPTGKRLTTFELEYPRFIHAEVMTHKMLSKNSASSRALPYKSMLDLVKKNMAMPIHWGKHQSGMGADFELTGWKLWTAQKLWIWSGLLMTLFAWTMGKIGLAKQVTNRILEPWTHIKIVMTGTEFDNFFYLRNHKDAQPEIHELARLMYECYSKSLPMLLDYGEWHLPYIDTVKTEADTLYFSTSDLKSLSYGLSLTDAKKISASMCAQVSYRKNDQSLDKAYRIYQRLVESKPVHASPFEHQGTPLPDSTAISGNFRGWKQFRSEIPGNTCFKYQGSK